MLPFRGCRPTASSCASQTPASRNHTHTTSSSRTKHRTTAAAARPWHLKIVCKLSCCDMGSCDLRGFYEIPRLNSRYDTPYINSNSPLHKLSQHAEEFYTTTQPETVRQRLH